MKFGRFDASGLPVAFYSDDINEEIPSDAVALTDEQWQEFIDNTGHRRWLNGGVVAYDPPPAPEPVAFTSKADIWRRCTDEEAVALASLLDQQTVRQQRLFNDATVLMHDDPAWPTLEAGVTKVVGTARAAAILAPSA